GTSKLTAEQVSREFFRLGVDLNVSADEEETRLSINGPTSNFAAAVELFENLLSDIQPDQKALNALVDREIKLRADAKLDKQTVLWDGLWNYAVYGKRNPFNDVISESQLRKLRAAKLTEIIRNLRNYRHDILYYGTETPERVAAAVRYPSGEITLRGRGGVTEVPIARAEYPPAKNYPRTEQKEDVIYFVNEDMVQAEIIWLRKGSTFDAQKWPTVEFFNEYYGGGMGAVVFQTIRESRALAYSSFARYDTPDRVADPAYSLAYLGTQADKVDEAVGAMRDLIRTMPRSESAFTSAREAIRNQIANDRTIRYEVLDSYLAMRRLGIDHELRRDVWAGLDNVSFDDIARFHSEQFGDRPFVMAIIGSRDRIDMKALARHGRIVEVTDKELFGY
ncbi:MAG: insulinase family protein, partial [bacterium]|nr:insulinase family protein [Candidatus Kapabacteria bacterium]